MGPLTAGIGKSKITPRVGTELMGYSNRPGPSAGVHDDLYARALVLDDGIGQVAFVSVEMLWLRQRDVDAVRATVGERCGLTPEQIFVFATHTHSGPGAHHPQNWERPLGELIADAVVQAYESRQPARLGAGFGFLHGYSINRRWLNRPVDPSVGVIRVDREDGAPLALLGNYACHAVVLGYDNLLISGDWPGYSSRLLEDQFGPGFVALFSQGGAGDINPLTETVRQRFSAGHPVTAIGYVSNFYGYERGKPDSWNIEDRGGGTFVEAETLARAYNAEVLRVWRSISTVSDAPLWLEQVTVEAGVGEDEPRAAGLPPGLADILSEKIGESIPMDIRLVGIGPAVLLGEPGEIFSETSLAFRVQAQQMGYGFPMLLSYANGSYAYIPPASAFPEGGYEVQWPLGLGISRHTHDRITAAIDPLLKNHAPGAKPPS